MTIRGLLLTLALSATAAGARADEPWRYVVPVAGDPFDHPPPRALALSDAKPSDLTESVRYRGTRRRYGQLTYGTGRTAAVAVVVDEVSPTEADLYVDADRDREITEANRVAGAGPTWRTEVAAVLDLGLETKEWPRTVLFRYGRASRTLGVATCGYCEGRVRLGDREVAARRVDGDANGRFADSQDRIWVDQNGDGRWDAATKEFLFAPILRLGERRYAVRADPHGERLSLAPLAGEGTLRLKLPAAIKATQVEEIQVTVQSRDGVVASVRGTAAELTLPAGDYRVSALLLTLKDPAGGPAWGYVFNDQGGKEYRWHALAAGGALALDPVGAPEFIIAAGDRKDGVRAGESLYTRPALYTGDGLLIERAYRGAFGGGPFDTGCSGRIALVGAGGRVLERASTGFA